MDEKECAPVNVHTRVVLCVSETPWIEKDWLVAFPFNGTFCRLTGCNPPPYNDGLFVRLRRLGVIICRLHFSNHQTSRKSVSMDSASG